MKDYFSHDYNARNDPRLVNLFMKHKLEGIGLYWCIIEMLYECNGYVMLTECERIAFELRTNTDFIFSIINDFDLFKSDKKKFWSDSVIKRLELRKQKSIKASTSASIRWGYANALQTQSDGNAIKVNKSKVNKSKVNKSKVNKSKVNTPNIFDFSFVEEEFKQPFNEWIEYKREKKQGYKTQKSLEACYFELKQKSNNNAEYARRIVFNSMANNYSGIYEPKNNNSKPNDAKQYVQDRLQGFK